MKRTRRGRIFVAAAVAAVSAAATMILAALESPLLAAALAFAVAFAATLTALTRQRARLQRLIDTAAAAVGDAKDVSEDPDRLGALERALGDAAAAAQATSSELASERARLALVLENVNDGLLALDEGGTVVLANGAALELLGISESPVGGSLARYVRVPALHELVADPGDEGIGEFELGNLRRIHARCTRLEGGGSLLVLRDVTALRRLETVRRDFVANVSHELRTPLAVIRANAETLIDIGGDDPEAAATLVEAIARQAERMNHIVNELLDLSRLEGGGYSLRTEPVDVAEVLDRAVDLVAHSAAAKGTEITLDVAPTRVLADDAALERILSNLLDNAVKHTPAGSEVTVRTRRDGDHIVLEVEDNGRGIELRHLPRLFERFYRADDGRSRAAGGTGLGLSIVKHLTELLGGSVSVDVGRTRGAKFSVKLPAAE